MTSSATPLRERREEVPPLVQHFLDKSSREAHKTGIRIADETMEYLILYNWPGNVRQLANEVRRLVALAESGAVLMPEHLSNDIASSRRTIPASERWIAPMEFVVHVLERFFQKNRDEATRIMMHVHRRGVGVCGVYTYEVAETKVTQVMDLARQNQHPLQCTIEKE